MATLKGLRFLVIDDVLPTRRVLKRLLFALGVESGDILEAKDAPEAIAVMSGVDPEIDIVISDFHLGESSGLDVLEFVRANSVLKNTPFVMITNDIQRDHLIKARELQVSSYLLKPLSIDNIYSHVREAIDKVERRDGQN